MSIMDYNFADLSGSFTDSGARIQLRSATLAYAA